MSEIRLIATYWSSELDASPEEVADAVRALSGVRDGLRFTYNPVADDDGMVQITVTADEELTERAAHTA